MGNSDSNTDPRFIVEVGSERFDPKQQASSARRMSDAGKKKLASALGVQVDQIPGAEWGAYLVQFQEELDAGTVERLEKNHGLRLIEGPDSRTFAEKMTAETATRIGRESVVRSCIPFWPGLRFASSNLATSQTPANDRRLRIRLIGELTDELTWILTRLGGGGIRSDRMSDGGTLVQLTTEPQLDVTTFLCVGEVLWIDEDLGAEPMNFDTSAVAQSDTPTDHPIWDKGIHGEGQIIGVLDFDLLDVSHAFFSDPDPNVTTTGPAHRKIEAIRRLLGSQPSGHATASTASALGDDHASRGTHAHRGGAWASRLVYTDVNRFLGGVTGATIEKELLASAAAGARVHSMSYAMVLVDPSRPAPYTLDAAFVDDVLWRNEHLVLVAAMTNSWKQYQDANGVMRPAYFGPPGTAKNPVGVSATQTARLQNQWYTGRHGTSDGRRTPDLMAVGEDVVTADLTVPGNLRPVASWSGTSFATPHVAAAAALVRQYYMDGWYPSGKRTPKDTFTPTCALIKATLLNATTPMNVSTYPTAREGWGRLRLNRTLHFDGDKIRLWVWDMRHYSGLDRDGALKQFNLTVPANAKTMKVTLVFNDPSGAVNKPDPVVNKLDIR